MGKWTREKVDSGKLNNGNEYEAKDRLSREQLNAIVNSGLYAQDFAEHLADTPDTSAANNVGTPSVEFIDNGIEFNPLLRKDPQIPKTIDEAQVGGLGIYFTKKLADECYYHYTNDENHLKIIKNVE